jgi:hypothetical protein
MRMIGRLGETVWVQVDELRHAAAVIGTVLCLAEGFWKVNMVGLHPIAHSQPRAYRAPSDRMENN